MSYSQLMISWNNNYTNAINHKESIVDIIDFREVIHTAEFKLECMVAPESHETNLSQVDE